MNDYDHNKTADRVQWHKFQTATLEWQAREVFTWVATQVLPLVAMVQNAGPYLPEESTDRRIIDAPTSLMVVTCIDASAMPKAFFSSYSM